MPDLEWEALRAACCACEKCALSATRHQVVFGVGNPQAEVLLIGEGPGENEDLRGEPFVGRGGQLLDKLLAAVGLSRQHNIYIANIVKCRPPKNRDPLPEEQAACHDWLARQMALLAPKIVVCLGRIAACQMIDPNFKVTRQHGQFFDKNGALYMGTFHPAALLRNPTQKPEAFADFLALREKITAVCGNTQLYYPDGNGGL